jgi:soluble lytic murein transglycosylase-like protein
MQGSHCATSFKALAISALLSAWVPAHACWSEAAARYRLSSDLLYAIARTESSLNPRAVGRNRDGSTDLGLMQVNSRWLPQLASFGISERELLQPCTNIHVGAWILAGNVQRLGYTWNAVGAYNATSPRRRAAYIARVRRHISAPFRINAHRFSVPARELPQPVIRAPSPTADRVLSALP